jgi:alkylation response protein AidB-like acyl-CoA dehydrogenase
MDFALSQDQKLMQASLAGTLDRLCPLERVRAFAEARESLARDVWDTLTELGVPGLLVPEEHGGLGLGLLDAALVAETLGAHVAPSPFLGSAVLAPLAILGVGSPAQQQEWLPKLAGGQRLAGAALAETISGARDGAGVHAAGGRLTGRAMFAVDAVEADAVLVVDASGALWLVAGDAPGFSHMPLTTIDLTRPVSELRFEATPAEALTSGDVAAMVARLRNAAWTLTAADMLGASEVMIDKAVAYAKERRQFGRLIGSFQAVKHLCAEMAAELEPCRALVWYAAYAQDAVPAEASLTAAHAKAHLSDVSRFVARAATEVHGGMGITDLLGLHYWFKRVGLDRQLFGGPERVRHLAAEMQGLVAA